MNIGVNASENIAEIWNPKQKLVFSKDRKEEKFNLRTFTWNGKQWHPFFDGENYIADGVNFNLKPLSCKILKEKSGHVILQLTGKKENALSTSGRRFKYTWDTRIEAFREHPWIKIATTIHLPEDLKLATPEPHLVLKFMGAHQNNVQIESTGSNDMPSIYYWTGAKNAEAIFFFNITDMKWMSKQNMRRFKDYKCSSEIKRKRGQRETSIGLLGLSKSGDVIQRGDIVLSYWLLENHNPKMPSQWDALDFMIRNSLKLLDSYSEKPVNATSWEEFARGCVKDLMRKYHCWINLNNIVGYRAYVAETCFKFGGKKGTVGTLEYITQTDVIWPWLLYLRIKPSKKQEEHLRRIMKYLPLWHDPKRHVILNRFRGKFAKDNIRVAPEKAGDTWYFFENGLIKTGWIAYLTED